MKKYLMSLALLGTFAAMSAKAEESYLYWFVDQSTGNQYNYTYAQLVAQQTNPAGDPIGLAAQKGGLVQSQSELGGGDSFTSAPFDMSGYGSGWSFFVELYNGENWLAQSATYSYEALAASSGFYKPMSAHGAAGTPTAFGTYNVPEPTSGLMMLLGVGLLALKRKKA